MSRRTPPPTRPDTLPPHTTRFRDSADGYGLPGVRVNGNDPEAMYSAFAEAVARARAGEGPTLLECMTFRFFGHYFGDDDSYIPKEQKAAAKIGRASCRERVCQYV